MKNLTGVEREEEKKPPSCRQKNPNESLNISISYFREVKMQKALILCEGMFDSAEGKSTHGLLRYSKRFEIVGVIDSTHAGEDSGYLLDGVPNGIPFYGSLGEALSKVSGVKYLIVGVATDGGKLPQSFRETVKDAMRNGLNIVSGLHEFLSDEKEFSEIANLYGVKIIDVRKLASGSHFFTGEIEKVKAVKIAVLGTDSAIGKRTTALIIKEALENAGLKVAFIGTGQTSWMQGEKYVTIIDSVINDFVSGELEYTVVQAYNEMHPDVIIIEGQGSILHPAYPGGFEIIASTRPDGIILQDAPKRMKFDGFPKYAIPSLKRFIFVLEALSGKKVIAVTINHENMKRWELPKIERSIEKRYHLPATDVIWDGADKISGVILSAFPCLKNKVKTMKKRGILSKVAV